MNEQLLTVTDLCERLKLSRGGIYNMVRVGTLPKPVKLSARCVRWRPEDVEAAIARLVDRSRGEGPK